MENKEEVRHKCYTKEEEAMEYRMPDQLRQAIINMLSNAIVSVPVNQAVQTIQALHQLQPVEVAKTQEGNEE